MLGQYLRCLEMKSGGAQGGGGAPPRNAGPGRRRGRVWGAAMAGRREPLPRADDPGRREGHRISSSDSGFWRHPQGGGGGCRRNRETQGGGGVSPCRWRHPQGGGGGGRRYREAQGGGELHCIWSAAPSGRRRRVPPELRSPGRRRGFTVLERRHPLGRRREDVA